jgi:NAD(P)-dependent dehydrogenase (short-subunit alcohol dehydrogenase family)
MDLGFNKDDSVLVTGGSRGIGAAIVHALAAEGVQDIQVVGRDRGSLESLAQDVLATRDVRLGQLVLDLSLAEDRARLAETMPRIDILVNNAGAIPQGGLPGADLDAWRRGWELKVWGYIELTKMALEPMTARGSGVILNIIGVSGERPDASYVAGSAANAALMTLTRAVGAHSLDEGVRVVGINPGPVETDRLIDALRGRAASEFGDAGRWRDYAAGYPAHRIATPEDVAQTAVFLASPRSSYTSGTVVTVDGGMAWRGRAL